MSDNSDNKKNSGRRNARLICGLSVLDREGHMEIPPKDVKEIEPNWEKDEQVISVYAGGSELIKNGRNRSSHGQEATR